jgi:hypothetical protein
MKDERGGNGDTLKVVKKRTKVLIGVGVGVVVALLLAGALLLRPPAPYDFLRGARLEGVHIHSDAVLVVTGTGPTSPPKWTETVTRSYWTPRTYAELEKSAPPEMASKGWRAPVLPFPETVPFLFFDNGIEKVDIAPKTGGGCYVHIRTQPNTKDRVQAWLWNLTHR